MADKNNTEEEEDKNIISEKGAGSEKNTHQTNNSLDTGEEEQEKTGIIDEDKMEDLTQSIIKKETNKYQSNIFEKIKDEVYVSLGKQKTDDALRNITLGALFLGSSDIHYDHSEKYIIVRFRIDGILVDIFRLENKQYKVVLERLKYASGLKLNISNIPQDGKYELQLEKTKIDVRVSTLPTQYGENIVSRILDSSKAIIDFEQLGFFWTSKRMIERTMGKRTGMILVTGPTGSGKTTTLYTMVSQLNTRAKKIITLEDPIEYQLEGIVQSEVNEKDGFSFEMGLRALMRQDPDIIMVGEIRGKKTLDIATSASLTGHLVLSTLHTKSAAETLDRIINMGLPSYILASALDTIIAQRLVRKICDNCKVEKIKTKEEEMIIKSMMIEIGMGEKLSENIKLYEGEGCGTCNQSGYKGRIGIFEIIMFNTNLRNLIRKGSTVEEILEEARKGDLITMKEDGILKAIRGYTTITEILRVI